MKLINYLFVCVLFYSCSNSIKNIEPPIVTNSAISEEIEVTHPDSTSLYGLIEAPSSTGSLPIVIFIAGSGPTDHDGNVGAQVTSGSYKLLSQALRKEGFATLRYDKRTASRSRFHHSFDPTTMSFDKFVEDLILFIDIVHKDERFSDVILAGHSQGSLIAILAAQQREIKSIISLAGAGRNINLIMRDQFEAMGINEDQLRQFDEACIELKSGNIPTEYPIFMMSVFSKPNATFMRSWMNYNPSEEINKLNIPILVVNGTTDIQVPVAEAESLNEGCSNCSLSIIDGMNHVLKTAPLDRDLNIKKYTDPNSPLTDGLVESIVNFLKE